MEALLLSTSVVALAEMGDKTQLLSFVLAAKLKHRMAIIMGIFFATLANHFFAGSVGAWLASFLSPQTLKWVVAVSFFAFGIWALRPDRLNENQNLKGAGVFVTTLIAFFILFLPSLVVTLGTLALYRGIAQVLLGDYSIQDMPKWFFGLDRYTLAGTSIPVPFVIFLVLALICALLLHKTVFGRWVYSLGTNERAAYFSGVPVKRVKLLVFTFAGFLAGLAALMLNSRLMVARYDHARGWELDAITAVVLGGTSIAGGRGSIYGTVVALFLMAVLRTAMGVANIKVEAQLTVIGTLLIVAVILSDVLGRRRRPRS